MASVPKTGEYEEGHLWFERSGTVLTLGVTTLAIEEIGAVASVELPEQGDDFDKGEIISTVTGANGSIDLICPAAGIIQEVNGAAEEDPTIIGEDPQEEGWIIKLEIQDTSDLKEFLSN